ncbi:DUF928 domain-containing protein [Capilliphycus salinus ALCB114379]|uniref:DUF928 domain-containing protein n=1 Tax=Capilliphycus salinus TaxID=2768948 RepID=UPI0039A5B632
MTRINLYFATLLFFLTLTGELSYGIDNFSKVSSSFQLASDDFNFDADGKTRPGNRQGAASRGSGNCPSMQPPLTALIPQTNLGLTTKEYPTFWFYVPYNSTDIRQAELIILDKNRRPALEEPISVQLSGTPGIIGITLPSTAKPLELEQEYRWFFELECGSDDALNNPKVNGWIKRVQSSQNQNSQLQNNLTQEANIVDANNSIWYDTLTDTLQKMRVNPTNSTLTNNWSDLLKSVELQEFVDTSITDCCSVK